MTEFPTYRNLGDHTETTDIDYDPNITDYAKLLKLFWDNHNTTTCQSAQYMSVIFYQDEEQCKLAEETKEAQQKKSARKIVTKILPAKKFYNAEDYHQKYMLRQNRALLSSLGLSDEELIKSHVAARLNGYISEYGNRKAFETEAEGLGLNKEQIEYVMKNL